MILFRPSPSCRLSEPEADTDPETDWQGKGGRKVRWIIAEIKSFQWVGPENIYQNSERYYKKYAWMFFGDDFHLFQHVMYVALPWLIDRAR